MPPIKTERELCLMRESGKILHEVLQTLKQAAQVGVCMLELDDLAGKITKQHQAISTFRGYRGFPGNVCLALNDEVVHGIPRNIILHEGDILGIDMGVTYKRMITDSAITVGVGKISQQAQQFITTTEHTLSLVLNTIRKGTRVGDIGSFIQERIEKAGYAIVRELTGHGVGRQLHENPFIPNYGRYGVGELLQAGQTVAIEPIIAMGSGVIKTDSDGWTIRTKDGSLACQFEHTIIVHDDYAEIVT